MQAVHKKPARHDRAPTWRTLKRRQPDPRSQRFRRAGQPVSDALQLAVYATGARRVRDSLAASAWMAAVELTRHGHPLVFVATASSAILSAAKFSMASPWRWRRISCHRDCHTGWNFRAARRQMTNPLTSMLPAFFTPEAGNQFRLHDRGR